jgi:hypothetical protein
MPEGEHTQELEITEGHEIVHGGLPAGKLKRIIVEALDPELNDNVRVRIGFVGNAVEDATAVCLNWDDLDSFLHMLREVR